MQINTNSLGLKQTAGNASVDESCAAASSTWKNCVLGLCWLPTHPADRRLQPGAIQAAPDRYNTRQLPPVLSSPLCQSGTELILLLGPQSSEAPNVTVLFKSRLREKCKHLLLLKHVTKAWSGKVMSRHSKGNNYKRAKWCSLTLK